MYPTIAFGNSIIADRIRSRRVFDPSNRLESR